MTKILTKKAAQYHFSSGLPYEVIGVLPDNLNVDADPNPMSFEVANNAAVGDYINTNNEAISPSEADLMVMANPNGALRYVIQRRAALLKETDLMFGVHQEQKALGIETTLSEEDFLLGLAYRQELRDFTDNVDLTVANMSLIDWPVMPTGLTSLVS